MQVSSQLTFGNVSDKLSPNRLVTMSVTARFTIMRTMSLPQDIVELTLSFLPEFDERFANIYKFCFYATTSDKAYFQGNFSPNKHQLLSINLNTEVFEVKIAVVSSLLRSQEVRDVECFWLRNDSNFARIPAPLYSTLRWMPYTQKIYTLAEYLFFGIDTCHIEGSIYHKTNNWDIECPIRQCSTLYWTLLDKRIPTNVLDPIRKILSGVKVPRRTGTPGCRTNPWIESQAKTNKERTYQKGMYYIKNTGRHSHRLKLLVWDGRTGKLAVV